MARANILFNVASVQVLPVPNWKLDLVLATFPHLDRRSLGEGGWQHSPHTPFLNPVNPVNPV